MREAPRIRRLHNKERGLCTNCGSLHRVLAIGRDKCQFCIDRKNEGELVRYNKRKAIGICPHHADRIPVEGRLFCEECLYSAKNKSVEAKIRAKQRQRALQQENKRLVISAYGGVCACCGETNDRFLQLDHINRDGAQHRREVKSACIYPWVIKNNFPPTLRLLCANCNWATRYGEECPHKQDQISVIAAQ